MGDSELKTDRLIVDDEIVIPNSFKDEGVPVSGGPHGIINFPSAGAIPSDGGNGKAIITVSGTGGGAAADIGQLVEPAPGDWFGPNAQSTISTGFLSVGRVYLHPFVLPVAATFDRIAAQNLHTGTEISVGVYTHVAGNPSAKVFSVEYTPASTPDDTSGVISPAVALPAGVYWFAVMVQASSSVAFRRPPLFFSFTSFNLMNFQYVNRLTSVFHQTALGIADASTYPLPASLSGPFFNDDNAGIIVQMRRQ
jgi:hypothetical protein